MRIWTPCFLVAAVVLAAAGCATSTSFRGSVEFGRMRVLTDVDNLPQPAVAPDVEYPEVLLAQGIEGTAEISFVVGVDGIPGDIKVLEESDPAFGEAAAIAVARLRYVPATRGGVRAACGVVQTFFFRIN